MEYAKVCCCSKAAAAAACKTFSSIFASAGAGYPLPREEREERREDTEEEEEGWKARTWRRNSSGNKKKMTSYFLINLGISVSSKGACLGRNLWHCQLLLYNLAYSGIFLLRHFKKVSLVSRWCQRGWFRQNHQRHLTKKSDHSRFSRNQIPVMIQGKPSQTSS